MSDPWSVTNNGTPSCSAIGHVFHTIETKMRVDQTGPLPPCERNQARRGAIEMPPSSAFETLQKPRRATISCCNSQAL